LDGKVALITAASRGIGLAVAEALVARGARTAICGRDEGAVNAAAAQLIEHGGEALGIRADLGKAEDVERLLQRIDQQLGPIDVLVCNTGGPPHARFVDATLEDWERWFGEMFYPVVRLLQATVPQMQRRGGGAVVFLTSTTVKQPRAGAVLSTTIRGAIAGMSKQLANELAPDGIRVNHVMPGPIETARFRSLLQATADATSVSLEERRALVEREVPLGRLGRAEEVAAAVAFLCSDDASFINGVTLQVDGGQTKSVL
jgi:3-oxoacyl-[acyl-carrier protein] reductase